MARTNNRNRKVYGRAKRLEMARSVLPSTSRQHAREALAAVRRTSRRAIARDLRRYTGAAEDATDRYDHDGLDLARYPNDEIKEIVCDRRSADKLGSFQRWAVETTRHLPVEDRLDAMRDVMPRNLIGRHAVSHLRWMDEFRWAEQDTWWRRGWYWSGPSTRDVLESAVRELLTAGRHRELNAVMKTSADGFAGDARHRSAAWHTDGQGRWYRVLFDDADVPGFVSDIVTNEYRCPGQYHALCRVTLCL